MQTGPSAPRAADSAAKLNRIFAWRLQKQFRKGSAVRPRRSPALAIAFETPIASARGAVDYRREQNIGEHRAFVKMELLVAAG